MPKQMPPKRIVSWASVICCIILVAVMSYLGNMSNMRSNAKCREMTSGADAPEGMITSCRKANITKEAPREVKHQHPWSIFTMTNYGFINFTRNWLVSLKRCGIRKHITIVAMDPKSYDELRKRDDINLDVILAEKSQESQGVLSFRSKPYINLVNRHPRYILDLLEQGRDVIASDVDVVLLQDPLPFFGSDYDVFLEDDLERDVYCVGFAFYRATNATRNLFRQWVDLIAKEPSLSYQILLNKLMESKNVRDSVRIKRLESTLFANGRHYSDEEWRKKHIHKGTVTFHNNWSVIAAEKVRRFRESGMWYL